MKKVGILYHPMIEATQKKAKELQGFLDSRGVSTWLCSAWDTESAGSQIDNTDLILTTGGDGTILRAAQVAVTGMLPITGVNLGKLGFMTELSAAEAEEKLPSLLEGKGWIDERAMLQIELAAAGQEPSTFHALNDVVLARGEIPRLVYVEASIDGEYLTTYKADGVMAATATGSTGYALSAGGPILYPQSRDFLLVPMMPHLTLGYALVLPPSAEIKLRITAVHKPTLSIDGHINLPLSSGDTVKIKLSSRTTRFLRINPENTFYRSLEEKLKGKQQSESDRKG